jgi:hypothetical protein
MITQEYLKSLLNYDAETGIFTWLDSRNGKRKIGSVAGGDKGEGYLKIKIDGSNYFSHRLAWLYITGNFPDGEIDHKNNIRCDNRFNNLRVVTRMQNMKNYSTPITNRSGKKGVSWCKASNKWKAQIQNSGKKVYLGVFSTINEAHIAYCEASKKYHGEYGTFK